MRHCGSCNFHVCTGNQTSRKEKKDTIPSKPDNYQVLEQKEVLVATYGSEPTGLIFRPCR
jgi:hypothetical protein